jgi:hypothetical protein
MGSTELSSSDSPSPPAGQFLTAPHAKWSYPQSTYMYSTPGVPRCLSPRPNWDPPPSPASECIPPESKGGGQTRLRVRGWGPNLNETGVYTRLRERGWGPKSNDWRKSLVYSVVLSSYGIYPHL